MIPLIVRATSPSESSPMTLQETIQLLESDRGNWSTKNRGVTAEWAKNAKGIRPIEAKRR